MPRPNYPQSSGAPSPRWQAPREDATPASPELTEGRSEPLDSPTPTRKLNPSDFRLNSQNMAWIALLACGACLLFTFFMLIRR